MLEWKLNINLSMFRVSNVKNKSFKPNKLIFFKPISFLQAYFISLSLFLKLLQFCYCIIVIRCSTKFIFYVLKHFIEKVKFASKAFKSHARSLVLCPTLNNEVDNCHHLSSGLNLWELIKSRFSGL